VNTELRELFESGADVVTAPDLAERAVRGARQRRRNRFVVGGAVLATAAVVLGVLVGTGQFRTDAEPRPTDVAAIPAELPRALGDAVPILEAGMLETASAAYVSDGVVAFVDASTGDVVRRTFGPPPLEGEGQADVLVPVLDVALSPDGRTAAVIVETWGREIPGQTLRLVDLASDRETLVLDLTPADDRGADSTSRPSVVAWENDSQHLVCSCAVAGEVPQLVRASLDGTWDPVEPSPSPLQVAAGTAGVAAQIEANGGAWLMSPSFAPSGGEVPGSYAAALGRESDSTFVAFRGSGYTVGAIGDAATVSRQLPEPSLQSQYTVVTDVDPVIGGFMAVVALAERSETEVPSDLSEAIVRLEGVFISGEGSYRSITRFPAGTVAASFASYLVAP
jgi:hypothetical protein